MNYDKLLEFEARKYMVFNLLKNDFMSVPDIMAVTGIERSKLQHVITSLMSKHHLHKSKRQASERKTLICYKATDYEYKPKDIEELEKYYNGRMKSMSRLAHNQEDEVANHIEKVNSTTTIYRLLNRKSADIPKNKPVKKSAYRGIGSSFALFDGV